MFKNLKYVVSLLVISFFLGACSGGGGSSSSSNSGGSGYLIDSPISGISYECGSQSGVTGSDGGFNCSETPVVFKIGNYTIGFISNMTSDSKIFPQDLLGLSRNNETDTDLIELVQFFQALDDDGDITDAITVSQNTSARFEDVEGQRVNGDGSDGTGGYGEGQGMTSQEALEKAGIPSPSPGPAMEHLKLSIDPSSVTPPDMSDVSQYVGTWVGSGWNWEVRFKHNSGDFTADMFNIDRSDVPFDTEKTIMSLTVAQQNSFTFTVDEDGAIDGYGVITYNLLPNLCGIHALTTQVNSAVNMMSKMADFFKLGSSIYKKTIEEFMVANLNVDNDTYNLIKDIVVNRKSPEGLVGIFGKTMEGELRKKAIAALDSSTKSGDVCVAAAGNAAYGGQSVGPMSVDDIWKNSQLDVAKALLSGQPLDLASLVLSIPGVTQVQYYYKGMQNGPETRNFTFSGNIYGDGEMFLEDVQIDGSPLVVEYTVNWLTETSEFPTWSPFLEGHGLVQAMNESNVIYTYETVMETKSYVDKSDGNKLKTVEVPVQKLVAQKIDVVAPMAKFNKTGFQRNGVSVWHDYEYNWNAYRVGD